MMQEYIFNSWSQVFDWIKDNKLVKFSFRADQPQNGERSNKVIFVYDEDETPEENLRLCEKRLQAHAGMHLYGVGYRTKNANNGGLYCEVMYNGYSQFAQMAGAQPVAGPAIDTDKLTREITEKVEMKMKLERLESERKAFAEEKKAFEEEKGGFIGALMHYAGPVLAQYMGRTGLASVAGPVFPGSAGNVEAERITPVTPKPEAEQPAAGTDDLPDDEAAKAYELLKRMRKVEPEYIRLLESVVTMAESGDQMYNMARGILLK